MKTYIAYIRTSTRRQDLGLEAQQGIINRFINDDDIVLETFSEQESGSKNERVELNKAILSCKKNKAILLIAKLDRLSRNVAFISSLLETDVEIAVADMPNADRFTLHIMASVAQQELSAIQKRTKEALDVIKSNIKKDGFHISKNGNRITKLGGNIISDENRLLGLKATRERIQNNTNLIKAKAFARSLREAGKNYVEITNQLNENGFKTARGFQYHTMSTTRLFM